MYGRGEGNELYIERYAGLFANTLRCVRWTDIGGWINEGMEGWMDEGMEGLYDAI